MCLIENLTSYVSLKIKTIVENFKNSKTDILYL